MTDGCAYQHNFSLHIFSVESESQLASVRYILQNMKIDRGMFLTSTVENVTLACGKDLKSGGCDV